MSLLHCQVEMDSWYMAALVKGPSPECFDVLQDSWYTLADKSLKKFDT